MLPDLDAVAEIGRRHELHLIYLFGSRGRAAAGPTSDWDFAVLFGGGAPQELLRKSADVELDLLKLVEGRAEIVALDHADPVLRFEAIGGRLLYARTERERVLFEAAVLRDYQDSAHRRRIYAEATRRYFLEGRA
jgi:predicted nucleotidyltransferase